MFRMILAVVVFFGMMYVLYLNGILVLRNKQALAFRCMNGGRRVKFARCTGVVTRIVRFREDGNRKFTLRTQLTAGTVKVQLQDRKRAVIAELDAQNPETELFLPGKERYRLVAIIMSASGIYELNWE